MPKKIKLQIDGQLRRIGDAPSTFELLVGIAVELSGYSEVLFQYEDEENELITLNSELEYQEALRSPSDILKIIVIGENQDSVNSSFFQNLRFSSGSFTKSPFSIGNTPGSNSSAGTKKPQIEYKEKNIQTSEWEELFRNFEQDHQKKSTGYSCKLCGKDIIQCGFICIKCDKMIICLDCEEQNTHQHPMIKAYEDYVNQLMAMPKFERKSAFPRLKSKTIKVKIIPENYNYEEMKLQKYSSVQIEDFSPTRLKKNFDDLKGENKIATKEKKEDFVTKEKKETEENLFVKIPLSSLNLPGLPVRSKSETKDKPEVMIQEIENPDEDLASRRRRMQVSLNKLQELGFTDRTHCTRVLIRAKYDLAKATEILLSEV